MEKETLLNIIASALELDASEITFEISQKNCEKWDSLAHLSILTAISQEIESSSTELRGLATCQSALEIYNVINGQVSD